MTLPDWHAADRAYQHHHAACPHCRAAGTSPNTQQRCPEGAQLWAQYNQAFDPPHVVRAGPRSWLAAKYGKLGKDWRDDLRAGFAECFRVLEPEGVLVFKWNETQVKLREVLALTPEKPLFGQVSGRGGLTHWLVFMKPCKVAT